MDNRTPTMLEHLPVQQGQVRPLAIDLEPHLLLGREAQFAMTAMVVGSIPTKGFCLSHPCLLQEGARHPKAKLARMRMAVVPFPW